MNNINLADEIKRLRREKSWSQLQLALASGISERTIQRIEKFGRCSQETRLALAAALEVDIAHLTSKVTDEPDDCKKSQRNTTENYSLLKFISARHLAFYGLLFMFPGLYFFVAAVLDHYFGFTLFFSVFDSFYAAEGGLRIFNMVSPIIFLGGLSIGITLNLLAMISYHISLDSGSVIGSIRLTPNLINGFAFVLGSFVILAMLTYAFAENFAPR